MRLGSFWKVSLRQGGGARAISEPIFCSLTVGVRVGRKDFLKRYVLNYRS